MWIQSLGWEDPLEKGKATHSSILAWRIPWGCKELDMSKRLSINQYPILLLGTEARKDCFFLHFNISFLVSLTNAIKNVLVYIMKKKILGIYFH